MARITVTSKGGAWRALARMVPQNITPVGALTRNGTAHAFGRDAMGEYWIFGDGRPEPLPKIRIEKGLGVLAMRQDPESGPVGDENEK